MAFQPWALVLCWHGHRVSARFLLLLLLFLWQFHLLVHNRGRDGRMPLSWLLLLLLLSRVLLWRWLVR